MKRTCAWCDQVITEGSGPVTHGICSICARDHFDVRVSFDSLLPRPGIDPVHISLRDKLIAVLESQGELLPSAGSPLQRLWALVNSENATIDQCVALIELDAALITRVFRFANSATAGRPADAPPTPSPRPSSTSASPVCARSSSTRASSSSSPA